MKIPLIKITDAPQRFLLHPLPSKPQHINYVKIRNQIDKIIIVYQKMIHTIIIITQTTISVLIQQIYSHT